MIKHLNIKDTNIAETVLKIQKAAYKIEAERIGYDKIPPLQESLSELQASNEIFYGYYLDNILVGLLSFKVKDYILDIHRMAVHPTFFRRGIANSFLQFIEKNKYGAKKIIVSTGKENTPAIHLYLKNGYIKIGESEISKGIYLTNFEKNLYKTAEIN